MVFISFIDKIPMNPNSFNPAWWLRNPHLQTIWPVILKRRIKGLVLERERVELPDGDFIDLDWAGREKSGPLTIILHGFEGSIDSHYAKGMLLKIQEQGWRGVFMHFRGCSGEPNRLPRGYHSGETTDIAYIVEQIHQREPDTSLSAIGYSLGGNVLLKWLGETQHANPLKAAISISVPFELLKASMRLQQGFSRFYQWYFLRSLRKRLAHKFRYVPATINPELFFSARTINEFDNHYTAPLFGFENAEHYYAESSSRAYLRHIKVPTLLLQAKDDPFMSPEVIPAFDELAPCVKLELMQSGGHVGFVAGKYPWRPEYWLEQRIPEFLREYV